MPWYGNLLIALAFIALIVFGIFSMRKRLLSLWKDVTEKEVIFYRQLEDVAKLFFANKELLQTEDNRDFYKKVTRYRKKRIRSLLLAIRQDIYNAIVIIYSEIEDSESPEHEILIDAFERLQKVRRVYNSKVLIYNQTINVFPTRYLALRMKLEMKEYFG